MRNLPPSTLAGPGGSPGCGFAGSGDLDSAETTPSAFLVIFTLGSRHGSDRVIAS